MPYFPTYQEMQDALESARLKMWHTHGKVVDFGGPEFTLYVMEGLGKMEAPKILDEPIGDTPTKVTVTKSFGVEGEVREPVDDDSGAVHEAEGALDEGAPVHEFVSNRNGKKCLECGEPPDHEYHQAG